MTHVYTTFDQSIAESGMATPLMAANAVSGGPLENFARTVSPPAGLSPESVARLRRRYALQRVSARLLPQMRVAHCMRRPQQGAAVSVLYHPAKRRASFGGLQTCGSPHVCPVCAAKIAERRAEEVTAGYDRWTAGGGVVLMLTLTLRHNRGDRLADLLQIMNEAYRRLRSGAKWLRWKARLDIAGSITAREYTYGESGWHPHLHALLFVRNTGQPWLDEFARWVKHTWLRLLTVLGGSAVADAQDLKIASSRDFSDYITKLGHGGWTVGDELSKLNTKKGRAGNATPWDLLADAGHGDLDAAERWKEYAGATFGRNALVWSPGLRSLLELDEELTDEEIAAQQVEEAIVLAVMDRECWRVVVEAEARADLLIVASGGDAAAVADFIQLLLLRE